MKSRQSNLLGTVQCLLWRQTKSDASLLLPTSTYLTLTSSQNNENNGGQRIPGELPWGMEWTLMQRMKEQTIVVCL